MKYKFIPHTADVKFQAFGKTLGECFENCVLAFSRTMCKSGVKGRKTREKIEVGGKDLESLLYNFLEEIIFLMDTKDFFAGEAKVKVDEKSFTLEGELAGGRASGQEIEVVVKAVTYNEMFVRKEKGRWVCQVVLDV
jgi:SHS2 domain-containing protein